MNAAAVDAYLAEIPQPHRKTLAALRRTLRRLLPHATEGLAYGMPSFHTAGKGVAAYAAFREHCGYFPMSSNVVATLRKELARFPQSKGGFRFGPATGLAVGLVRKLVRARLAELSQPPASGNGVAVAFYDDGAPRFSGRWRGGKQHGTWQFFRRDGSLMRSGRFTNGVPTGTWRTFDRRGRLVKETQS